uniref:Peptidase S1 domain-containing protein n=1 Tax=Anopheles christyi TaxID=43041 RepID=A0A182K7H5_9DIPT
MVKVALASILLLGAIIGCQSQTGNVVRNVIFGEFPSVVYISTPRHQRCLGTVINGNHVLTSGSCVMTNGAASIYPARLVQVFGGDLSATSPVVTRQTRTAEHIFVHENYRVNSNDNNVAVIRLTEPFHLPSNGIEEAHIRMRIVPQGHQCDVVRGSLTGTPVLEAYNVQIRNRNLCEQCCIGLFRDESNMCSENISIENHSILAGDPLFCDGELTAVANLLTTTIVQVHFTQIRFLTHWLHHQLNRTQPMPEGWNPNDY